MKMKMKRNGWNVEMSVRIQIKRLWVYFTGNTKSIVIRKCLPNGSYIILLFKAIKVIIDDT